MRKYAYLKRPIPANEYELIYKIMLYETEKEGIYVFQYTSPTADFAAYDSNYDGYSAEDVMELWQNEIDERGWIDIGAPLPYCQHDCIFACACKRA